MKIKIKIKSEQGFEPKDDSGADDHAGQEPESIYQDGDEESEH